MDQPLGRAVGNALEIREARRHAARRGPGGLHRARPRRLRPAARALRPRDRRDGGPPARRGRRRRRERARALRALDPGPGRRPRPARRSREAPVRRPVTAPRDGVVTRLGALAVGIAALELGAGRRTKEDPIDHAVGVLCFAKRGDTVLAGDDLAEVHARDDAAAERRPRRCSPRTRSGTSPPGARHRARRRGLRTEEFGKPYPPGTGGAQRHPARPGFTVPSGSRR